MGQSPQSKLTGNPHQRVKSPVPESAKQQTGQDKRAGG